MALLAMGSALVAGSSQESPMQVQLTKVRVVRAFYFDKKPTKVDTIVEVPKIFAAEMVAANKAEFVDSTPEPTSERSGASGPKGSKLV